MDATGLKYRFNIQNPFAMAGLGFAFGKAAAAVHDMRAPILADKRDATIFELSGKSKSGKSIFARAALEGMVNGYAYTRDEHTRRAGAEDKRLLQWVNVMLPVDDRQHRLMDHELINAGSALTSHFRQIPDRIYSGVDFIERPAPGSSHGLMASIQIGIFSETTREVAIEFLQPVHQNLLIAAQFPGALASAQLV